MILRSSSSLAAGLVVVGIVAAQSACSETTTTVTNSSSSSSGTSGSASPAISATECKSRCSAKLAGCQAPAALADQGCTQLCGGTVTEAQATCLESKDCDELAALEPSSTIDSVCPAASSSSSSGSGGSSSSSSSSSSSGSSGNQTPESLTITATIPSDYKAIHAKSGDSIASIFSVAPQPTFNPSVQISAAHLPLLDKAASVTLDSPTRPTGACGTSKFSFVLNSTQIGVQISGDDTLPETGCATFTDALVKGATFTLKGVPWNNSSVKATVKIVLQ